MVHIKPSEMLLPEQRLSGPTEKLLSHFNSQSVTSQDRIRVERFKTQKKYTQAFEFLSDFYTGKTRQASESFNTGDVPLSNSRHYAIVVTSVYIGRLFAVVKELPQKVCIALAHIVEHLRAFGLAEALTRTEFFSRFAERQHMLLNANTLANLFVINDYIQAINLTRIPTEKSTGIKPILEQKAP